MKYGMLLLLMVALPAFSQLGGLNKLKGKKNEVQSAVDKNKGKVLPASDWVDKFDYAMGFVKGDLQKGYIGSGTDRNINNCENAIDSVRAIKSNHKAITRMESELSEQKNVYNEIVRKEKVKRWSERFSNIMGIIEGDLAKGYISNGTNRRFEECTQAMDSLRKFDPGSADLQSFETKYKEQARIKYVIEKTDEFDRLFLRYEMAIKNYRSGQIDYLKGGEFMYKIKFDSVLSNFKDDNLENVELDGRCKAIEVFFNDSVEKGRTTAIGHFKYGLSSSYYWSEQNRQKPSFFDEFKIEMTPRKDTVQLQEKLEAYNVIMNVFPNLSDLKVYKDSVDLRLKDLKNLVSSGELDEWRKKAHQRKIDQVFPFKNLKSDGSIVSAVKKGHISDDGYGSIVKVNIVDAAWGINKLYNGRISSKTISVQVITKDEEGLCWLGTSHVKKEYYEGTYGAAVYWNGPSYQEMNCANMNKSIPVPRN